MEGYFFFFIHSLYALCTQRRRKSFLWRNTDILYIVRKQRHWQKHDHSPREKTFQNKSGVTNIYWKLECDQSMKVPALFSTF